MAAKTLGKSSYRRFLTTSNQLATLGAIGVSIGFVVVIWIQTNQARSLLYDAELHHNIHMAELVAAQLYAPLRSGEAEAVRKAYAPIVADNHRDVVAAVTLDRDGKLLAAYQKNAADPAVRQGSLVDEAVEFHAGGAHTAIRDGRLVVATPVLSDNGLDRAGTLVVAWSLTATDQATQAMFLRAASITLVVLAVFVILSLTIVHRRLSDPLSEIAQATTRIANGDKHFAIPWAGRKDEIGDMARALVTFRENVALIDRLTAEQQQQTQRLANALEKEREYNTLHGEFVSMVSHEFRTPVAIIDGAAQRIERRIGKDTPDQLRDRIDKIRSAVARMVELIDSTLSVSRMEAGTIDLELAECDFAELLRDVCQRQQGISKDHKIKLTVADIPPRLLIDARRMDQVFTNLLSNAVKYAPDAPNIDVKAGTVGDSIVVSVRDFGLGIPEDELPKLFEKFFRASTSTGIPGTGIGLHLVKYLVGLHEGSITVDSTERSGTTFSVTFPIRLSEEEAAATAENLEPAAFSA